MTYELFATTACLGSIAPAPVFMALSTDDMNTMQGVVIGTSPIDTARVANIELPDEYGLFHTYGQELGWYGGAVSGGVGSRAVIKIGDTPWVSHAPTSTNWLVHSRDFSEAYWVPASNAATVTSGAGIDGSARHLVITDDSATSRLYSGNSNSPLDVTGATEVALVFYIRKAASPPSAFPMIGLRQIDGTEQRGWWNINLYDGSTAESSSGFGDGSISVQSHNNDWWKVGIYLDGIDDASSMRTDFYPTFVSSMGGAADDAAQGSITVDAINIFTDISLAGAMALPPIYTETIPILRDSDEIEIPLANHSDTGAVYMFDAEVTGECNVLGSFLLYDSTAGGSFTLTDGTNSVSSTGHAIGQYSIEVHYGGGSMHLVVDGVATAPTTYDGTLQSAPFKIFSGSLYVGKMRELERYDPA